MDRATAFRPDQMQAALSFLWSLRRDEVLAALESRIVAAGAAVESRAVLRTAGRSRSPATPDHVVEMFRITNARDRGELEWTRQLPASGSPTAQYSFAGEASRLGPARRRRWHGGPPPAEPPDRRT